MQEKFSTHENPGCHFSRSKFAEEGTFEKERNGRNKIILRSEFPDNFHDFIRHFKNSNNYTI